VSVGSGAPAGSAGSSGAAAPSGAPTGSGGSSGAGKGRAPGVALDCFAGSGTARLTDLHAPTIVTLWASWCEPCAQEMPAFQAVADKAQGRMRVIGVVTFDHHDRAQAFIDEHKVSFPMLDDPDKHLLIAVGRAGLPVTLFLTADGHLAHLYDGAALDEPTLESMAATYLGVTA
jgi:cytochrome c biogenesis protein CcmG/thiol:disulfide interchange protein DsbE